MKEIAFIVNMANKQKSIKCIKYLEVLGYKLVPGSTYETYLKIDYKHRYFIGSQNGFIYQDGTCEELITIKYIIKNSFIKADSIGYFNSVSIENHLDIE